MLTGRVEKNYMEVSNFVNLFRVIIFKSKIKCISRDKFKLKFVEKSPIFFARFINCWNIIIVLFLSFAMEIQIKELRTNQTNRHFLCGRGKKKYLDYVWEDEKKCDQNDKTSLKLMVDSLLSFASANSKILFERKIFVLWSC